MDLHNINIQNSGQNHTRQSLINGVTFQRTHNMSSKLAGQQYNSMQRPFGQPVAVYSPEQDVMLDENLLDEQMQQQQDEELSHTYTQNTMQHIHEENSAGHQSFVADQ